MAVLTLTDNGIGVYRMATKTMVTGSTKLQLCPGCKKTKSITQFHKSRSNTRLVSLCRTCRGLKNEYNA